MRYALIDGNRTVTNIIEIEPDIASEFDAHYLGGNTLGIGDTYPETDFAIPSPPTIDDRLAALESATLDNTEMQVDQDYRLMCLELNINTDA